MAVNRCQYTGCAYTTVEGDGLCLYRAASVIRYGTETVRMVNALHRKCVNTVADNWATYRERYTEGGRCKYKSGEDYRKHCLKPNREGIYEYATDVEIDVLSNELGLNIILIGVGKSQLHPEEDVYPLGFIGSPQNTGPPLAIRVRNHGSLQAHFEPFLEIPDGWAAKLTSYLIEVFGDVPAPLPSTPRRGGPGRSPAVTPQQPTPKSSKRKAPLDVPHSQPKVARKLEFEPPTSSRMPSIQQLPTISHVFLDPTAMPTEMAVEFVDHDYSENDDMETNSEFVDDPSSKQCSGHTQNDIVPRTKPWCALPSNPTHLPPMSMKKNGGCKAKFYMAAAVHGDEKYDQLKPLRLPALSIECEDCGALFRPTELYSAASRPCCQRRVTLDTKGVFKKPTGELLQLFTNKDHRSKQFKANILAYNRMFSTVQFRRRTTNQTRKGPYTVQSVNGKVTFEPNSFAVDDVLAPGQIYFVENNHDTVNFRMATSCEGTTIDRDIVKLIEDYLQTNNAYVRCFKTTMEIKAEEDLKAAAEGRPPRDVILAINPRPKEKSGYRMSMVDLMNYILDNEYSRPCGDFLAAVFYGDLHEQNYDTFYVPRSCLVTDEFPRLKGQELTIDIQTYPLIHLHGEESWTTTHGKVNISSTLREYYNYRLQIRNDAWNPLFTSGRLFSEYLLNAAIRIEKSKLDYLKENQNILHITSYKSLRNYVRAEAKRLNKTFLDSNLVILPKTFVNSPRYRQGRFLNGMAMARRFGPPTYFITMTTNPKWPEIVESLKEGEVWMDRPDIIVRVFQDRKRHLMSDLVDKQLFGEVKAYFTTDEFQKSSLPHVHILLFMVEDDKPKSAEELNRVIQAEIPDKNHPAYSIVVEQMMHHACDKMTGRRKPGCFADGKKCRFRYPQAFSEESDLSGRFVVYRRRQDGKQVKCRSTKLMLDNRNTVPTNHYLCIRHNCHICVVYSKSTVESFKYLCMYFNKGGEHTYVSLTDKNKSSTNKHYEWDEIEHYRECRYVNAAEAVYIIKSHSLGSQSHSVMVLPFHEEDEQTVLFEEGEEAQALINAKDSPLMAFFKLNAEAKNAEQCGKVVKSDPRDVLYVDMPLNFTWDKKGKTWHVRQRSPQLGRLGLVVPNANNIELFHLRSLLMNIPGPTSHTDLKTKDGKIYDTYTEACVAWGLTENSLLSFQILDELVTVMGPRALRYNFCMVIKHCMPHSALALWEKYKDQLSDDFAPRTENPSPEHHRLALYHIFTIMKDLDIIYAKTDLPDIDQKMFDHFAMTQAQSDRPTISRDEYQNHLHQLRLHQRLVFDKVITKIEQENCSSNMLLLLGAGGVGKTFLYNTIIRHCKINNIKFGACAYTGVAATLLIHGQTSHRLFGIPIKESDGLQYLSNQSTQSEQARTLKEMKVIIWDEISMVHKWQFELVDKYLRKLSGVEKPFGGKIMILSGSLRQILPVIRNGGRAKIVQSCVTNSYLWQRCEIIELTQNIRAENDPDFADWLLKIGDASANNPGTSRLDLPLDMRVDNLDALIKHTFPNGPENATGEEVILTPLNTDMREINDRVAAQLPGKSKTYLSYNKFTKDDKWDGGEVPINTDILESTEAANLPPHRLNLKEGSIVMLLCNLDVKNGLCNGSRFKVLQCLDNSIKCQRLHGPKELRDEPVYLFKVLISKDDTGLPGVITRQQFPIRLAYCVTVNKSQGSTYVRVGLHLPAPCFSHGQLYVALSRAKTKDAIRIHLRAGSEQGYRAVPNTTFFTRNEVYREVLNAVRSHPNYTKLV